MKKLILVAAGMIMLLGMTEVASAQPSPTMYTLDDIYYYFLDGIQATEGGHSLEPPLEAMPGDTRFKTLAQIYQDTETKFGRCDVTAADVAEGKVFFSTEATSWGAQTGTAVNEAVIMVTGQTKTYRTGDDGYYQKGTAFDYTDNADGTITDNVTGLMWAKDGSGEGCKNGNRYGHWEAAIDWAEGLIFAGYDDWRMPNIAELFSITLSDKDQGYPTINQTMFPNTIGNRYFSSTTAPTGYRKLLINFFESKVQNDVPNTTHYIRVVRGGISSAK